MVVTTGGSVGGGVVTVPSLHDQELMKFPVSSPVHSRLFFSSQGGINSETTLNVHSETNTLLVNNTDSEFVILIGHQEADYTAVVP